MRGPQADTEYLEAIAALEGTGAVGRIAPPRYHWFRDLRLDPELLRAPTTVIPRLAWEGRATLLSAQEKLGKSTLVGQAVAALVTGGEFLGQAVRPGRCLWLALDEPLGDLVRRQESFGTGEGELAVCDYRPTHAELSEMLQELRPTVLIIDCLSSFAAGQIDSFKDADGWRWLLGQQLFPVTRETGTAIVLIHHTVRDGTRYADSREIGAAVDFIVDLQASTESPTQRAVKGKGRGYPSEWASYSLEYSSGRYHLASGALSIETRTLLAIQENPGVGLTKLRQVVSGRNSEVDAAAWSLIRAGQVEDRGSGTSHSYYVTTGQGRPTAEHWDALES